MTFYYLYLLGFASGSNRVKSFYKSFGNRGFFRDSNYLSYVPTYTSLYTVFNPKFYVFIINDRRLNRPSMSLIPDYLFIIVVTIKTVWYVRLGQS